MKSCLEDIRGNGTETGDARPTEETQNVQSKTYLIEELVNVGGQSEGNKYNFMGTLGCLDIPSDE